LTASALVWTVGRGYRRRCNNLLHGNPRFSIRGNTIIPDLFPYGQTNNNIGFAGFSENTPPGRIREINELIKF